MLTAALVLAAEAAKGSETSKTAFYVAGGLLAVSAVLLSMFGLSRPSFPGNRRAERGLLLVIVLLVAAAMVTAVVTA